MINDTIELTDLIGDINLFKPVLDGFFKGWKGTYDILSYKNNNYLFHPKYVYSKFCETIRSYPEGEALCLVCDKKASDKALSEDEPIDYLCHAGLVDIAATIKIENKCFATVFCGQRRSMRKDDIELSKKLVKDLENKFNINLMDLYSGTVTIDQDELRRIKENLKKLTKYLSNQWGEKLELIKGREELKYHVKESNAVRAAFISLNEIPKSEIEFWNGLNLILKQISEQFEAEYASVFLLSKNEEVILKSVYNLPNNLISKTFNGDRYLFNVQVPLITNFDLIDGSINVNITELSNNIPDKIAIWPFQLNDEKGVLALYLRESYESRFSLPISKELSILEPFIGQISTAYGNFKLIEEERKLKNLQSDWLQDVVHEVDQPINGILGYAENWHNHLKLTIEKWEERKNNIDINFITDIKNCFESIEWMSINAAGVARNFAWIAGDEIKPTSLALTKDIDLVGLLIACARDKQGQANSNGIMGPNVIKETLNQFSKKVKLDVNFFKHAMRNLLDNAVKYASPNTTVIISGFEQDNDLHIQIKNNGKVPILLGEEENVFIRKNRTQAAKESGISGSGIGLAISREILKLHGGDIKTYPSKKQNELFETVFDVILPLIEHKENINVK